MSVTPSPITTSNNLEEELKQQYQGLTDEVKAYFDKQEADFLAQSKSKYQTPDSYYQDRGKFLVRQKIDDLESHRREIWSYLTSEFNRNTNDKNLNAKLMSQNKKDVLRHQKELQKYQTKLEEAQGDQYTSNRLREIELYELKRRKSQVYLMKVVCLVLLVCSVSAILVQYQVIPHEAIYGIILIFCGMICYIIYYLYLQNPGRSRRNWDKYYFEQPVEEIKKELNVDEINYDKLDQELDKKFNQYLDSCAAKGDPQKNTTQTPKVDTTKLTPST